MKKATFLRFAVLVLLLISYLFAGGVIVLDHSAVRRGEGVCWRDTLYVPAYGEYSEGRTLAKTEDGWRINAVKEDPSHTFVVLRSFLDQYLLVREDYEIPDSGKITAAAWGAEYITDDVFLRAVTEILANATTDFEMMTEGIYQLKDGQVMRSLTLAYEDCPLPTEAAGYLGKIDGLWCITTYIASEQRNADGSPKEYLVRLHAIDAEYHAVLAKYFEE